MRKTWRDAGWRMLTLGLFAVTGIAAAEEKVAPLAEPLAIVATVVRGDAVSRLSVYLENKTDRSISFDTGARGGPGSLDDRVLVPAGGRGKPIVAGTAPTVIPVFTVEVHGAYIKLEPPRIGGLPHRAMRPQIATIPAKSRMLYASFAVPSSQIGGRLVECEMTIRGEKDGPEPDVLGRWEMRLVTRELREEGKEE